MRTACLVHGIWHFRPLRDSRNAMTHAFLIVKLILFAIPRTTCSRASPPRRRCAHEATQKQKKIYNILFITFCGRNPIFICALRPELTVSGLASTSRSLNWLAYIRVWCACHGLYRYWLCLSRRLSKASMPAGCLCITGHVSPSPSRMHRACEDINV